MSIQKVVEETESLIRKKDIEIRRLTRERDEWRQKALTFEGQAIKLAAEKKNESDKKLTLLNSLDFIESEGGYGELYYVYVKKTPESVEILLRIGVSPGEIEEMTDDEGELIDVSRFAFQYSGATWFDGERFLPFLPEDAPEWCK